MPTANPERDYLSALLADTERMIAKCPVDDHLGRMGFEAKRDQLAAELEAMNKV